MRPLRVEDTLEVSERADFCVGCFNLRGWRKVDHLIETTSQDVCSPCPTSAG